MFAESSQSAERKSNNPNNRGDEDDDDVEAALQSVLFEFTYIVTHIQIVLVVIVWCSDSATGSKWLIVWYEASSAHLAMLMGRVKGYICTPNTFYMHTSI